MPPSNDKEAKHNDDIVSLNFKQTCNVDMIKSKEPGSIASSIAYPGATKVSLSVNVRSYLDLLQWKNSLKGYELIII